jgi:hypothetical protein
MFGDSPPGQSNELKRDRGQRQLGKSFDTYPDSAARFGRARPSATPSGNTVAPRRDRRIDDCDWTGGERHSLVLDFKISDRVHATTAHRTRSGAVVLHFSGIGRRSVMLERYQNVAEQGRLPAAGARAAPARRGRAARVQDEPRVKHRRMAGSESGSPPRNGRRRALRPRGGLYVRRVPRCRQQVIEEHGQFFLVLGDKSRFYGVLVFRRRLLLKSQTTA